MYVGALFHPLFGASERGTLPELGLNGPHNASKRQELLRARRMPAQFLLNVPNEPFSPLLIE